MTRPCTCHPDDNPPVPCPQKFALTECRKAAERSATAYRNTIKDLRALSHVVAGSDDRELLQHAADLIEVLAKPSHVEETTSPAAECEGMCGV